MYFLYSLLMAAAVLLASPFLILSGLRNGKYLHNIAERFGKLPPAVRSMKPGCIWLHAVSVGEALAAAPLARRLKSEFPGHPLLISTTTATGQKIARERLDFADGIFYFPFDWAWVVRRVLRAVKPACIIIMETEIWPNFMRESRRAGVPVVFANGRISDRSFHRHERALSAFGFFLRGFYKRVLAHAALFLMQSETDAGRIRAMGAPPERVVVAGNIKYDSPLPKESPLETWLADAVARKSRRPLIVAGSVTASEEPLVLIAFGVLQGQMRDSLLVLAPRKPERFDAAAQHIEESQRGYLRRSKISVGSAAPPGSNSNDASLLTENVSVILLDTIGELAGLYRVADAVFIGGSLVPAGGHNILEPAGFGRPPLFGPSMENFQEIASAFLARGAGRRVESPEDLGVAWIELMQNDELRNRMGKAARALVEENRGATERTLKHIKTVIPADIAAGGAPKRDAAALNARSGA